ncbi:substrate-binding periplasmic protein [Vibrio sinaloensis]|uniref:Solute-binding protein family 3/N-terminal domain-containing protein n=1 Tax=Photobacterium sp. (strain ATCC 43367) TaxID=379097 RepID=A0A0A5HTX0_PHOS4|nr:transporter substrate-binding domain-containing protein [Vibrio sinaloensis]KGY07780.1 hypothetical protein NM06_15475 [Vibrio sinaloensis]KIE19645.1 hypothetical protein SE23_15320 [Vibrio sinaloensis]
MKSVATIMLGVIALFAPHTSAKGTDINILCENGMHPFSWQENGVPQGIVIEMIEAMLNVMGDEQTIETYPWGRVYKLGLTTPNTMICTMARTAEREPLFKWVGEVFSSPPVLVALKHRDDIQVDSFQDLRKYSIGTHSSSFRERYLVARELEIGVNIFPANSHQLNYEKLKKGRVDLWSIPLLLAYDIINNNNEIPNETIRIVYTLDELPQGQFMAFNIDTPDHIVSRYREALETIKSNGTSEEIISRYIRY